MKKFSKILSVALLVALVLSFGAMAYADGEGEGNNQGLVDPVTNPEGGEGGGATTPVTRTITLNKGKAGHTYTAYQIFIGETTSTEDELINIQWGADAPDALKTQYETAAAAADAITDARAFAQGLSLTGDGTAQQTLTEDGTVTFENLAEGYYVIIDSNGNQAAVEGDYSSAVIVQVVANVTMDLKGSGSTSEKKVKDVNDSVANSETDWQDSADYDIGDFVPFQLKATTADNVAAYKKYHITFQDTQSAGLDMPTSWTVTVLGKTFTLNATTTSANATTDNGTKITVEKVDPESGKTFAIKVTFEPTGENVTYLKAECNSIPILVNYESKLNNNAKFGAEGNSNTSYIKYSNNPEDNDDSDEGKTPDDTVIVFTYKPVINKIDGTSKEPLKGAGFTLYKKVVGKEVNGEMTYPTGAKTGANIKATLTATNSSIEASKLDDTTYYVENAMTLVTGSETQFEFKGIDDGTYVLVETLIPTGYNAFDSKEFTVTAEHEILSDDPSLTSLTGGNVLTGDVNTGVLSADIENNSGTVLPSTGGIGTTIFYVVGGVLVLAAIILLVTKKRMSD